MPKRKNFNRRALSCTSTRTHLEGRRSVVLMDLRFKPVRASRVQGFQGPYRGTELLPLYLSLLCRCLHYITTARTVKTCMIVLYCYD